jgi:hypothetical protein
MTHDTLKQVQLAAMRYWMYWVPRELGQRKIDFVLHNISAYNALDLEVV